LRDWIEPNKDEIFHLKWKKGGKIKLTFKKETAILKAITVIRQRDVEYSK